MARDARYRLQVVIDGCIQGRSLSIRGVLNPTPICPGEQLTAGVMRRRLQPLPFKTFSNPAAGTRRFLPVPALPTEGYDLDAIVQE